MGRPDDPGPPEERFTLAEAKKRLGKEKCKRRGHQFVFQSDEDNDPVSLTCTECEENWTVVPQA